MAEGTESPVDEETIRRIWAKTLGPDADPAELAAAVTYKPAPSQSQAAQQFATPRLAELLGDSANETVQVRAAASDDRVNTDPEAGMPVPEPLVTFSMRAFQADQAQVGPSRQVSPVRREGDVANRSQAPPGPR